MHFQTPGLACLAVLAHAHAFATPESHREIRGSDHPFRPQAKSSELVANVTDPGLTRDSCGSVKMGARTLWTCRDTSVRIPNMDEFAWVFVNTVGWTDHRLDGSPAIQNGGPQGVGSDGSNAVLLMSGPRPTLPAFYPLGSDMCPPSGKCDDDDETRWISWPDSPPMIAKTEEDGTITAYTWITNHHILSANFGSLVPQPSTTLYKMTYEPNEDPNVVPNVTAVDTSFWEEHQISFGSYGNVVKDGYAYLYGLTDQKAVALARVPVESVEDKTKYEYYVNSRWTDRMPAINDEAAVIPNAGTSGQGTFYHSERHQSYIWIGQTNPGVTADFYVTTAPSAEGPWMEPYLLYQDPNGDGEMPSYSLQAHPHMLREVDDGIYLTWT